MAELFSLVISNPQKSILTFLGQMRWVRVGEVRWINGGVLVLYQAKEERELISVGRDLAPPWEYCTYLQGHTNPEISQGNDAPRFWDCILFHWIFSCMDFLYHCYYQKVSRDLVCPVWEIFKELDIRCQNNSNSCNQHTVKDGGGSEFFIKGGRIF